MRKVIAVIGPTGVGKTALGVELAKWLNTEIISGDSIQVYRGLDIGSAKVTEDERQGVPHHLIDIMNLEEHYSVYDFQQMGRAIMDDLFKQNRVPIVVGGTGLYIKSLLYDYTFEQETPSDYSSYQTYSNDILYERLKNVDPVSASKIHPNNRQRVIRALAIFDTHGKRKSEMEEAQKHVPLYDAFIIGLTCEREVIYERINKRVDLMVKAGLLTEINQLKQDKNLFSYQGMQGIGYKEFKDYFEGSKSMEETLEEIKKHSRQFAKRQYTWFNNQMNVHWFDISKATYKEDIKRSLKEWLEDEE